VPLVRSIEPASSGQRTTCPPCAGVTRVGFGVTPKGTFATSRGERAQEEFANARGERYPIELCDRVKKGEVIRDSLNPCIVTKKLL
jgi:hypothetical protein